MRKAQLPLKLYKKTHLKTVSVVALTAFFISITCPSWAFELPNNDNHQSSKYFSINSNDSNDLFSIQSVEKDFSSNSTLDELESRSLPWWHDLVNSQDAWSLSAGQDTTVAILDTGVDYTHQDLKDQMWINTGEIAGDGIDNDGNGYVDDVNGYDFHNLDSNPLDDHYHGTHVAGIVGAAGDLFDNIVGIAPRTKIMAVKVLDQSGSGYMDSILDGIVYAARMGANVINLSLGTSSLPTYWINAFQSVVNYAVSLGSVVVAAAGNTGHTSNPDVGYPAKLDNVISVGATDWNDNRAYFSSYGPELDFVAPGYSIDSLIPSNRHAYLSGTSMSTPVVSGVISMLLSQDPTLGYEGIMRRLKFSSTDLGDAGYDQYYGWGKVNALKALSYDYYDSGVVKHHYLAKADVTGAIQYDYDANGRLVTQHQADGSIINYVYLDGGNKLFQSIERDALGKVVSTTTYHPDGETVKSVVNADGSSSHYDEEGNLVKEIDSEGNVTEYGPAGKKSTYTQYDSNGNKQWTAYYDSDGNRIKYVEFRSDGSISHEYEYDSDGNKIKYVKYRSNGSKYFEYSYDSSGNITEYIRYRSDGSVYFTDSYEGGIKVSRVIVKSNGTEVHYEYFSNGKRKSIIRYRSNGSKYYEYTYNEAGQKTKYVRYHSNGSIYYQDEFANGIRTSRIIIKLDGTRSDYEYHDNGKSRYLVRYRPDGSKFHEYFYDENGKRTKYVRYHANGSVYITDLYENGIRRSRVVKHLNGNEYHYEYDENGKRQKVSVYRPDQNSSESLEQTSSYVRYNARKSIFYTDYYENGKRVRRDYYDSAGSVIRVRYY